MSFDDLKQRIGNKSVFNVSELQSNTMNIGM